MSSTCISPLIGYDECLEGSSGELGHITELSFSVSGSARTTEVIFHLHSSQTIKYAASAPLATDQNRIEKQHAKRWKFLWDYRGESFNSTSPPASSPMTATTANSTRWELGQLCISYVTAGLALSVSNTAKISCLGGLSVATSDLLTTDRLTSSFCTTKGGNLRLVFEVTWTNSVRPAGDLGVLSDYLATNIREAAVGPRRGTVDVVLLIKTSSALGSAEFSCFSNGSSCGTCERNRYDCSHPHGRSSKPGRSKEDIPSPRFRRTSYRHQTTTG